MITPAIAWLYQVICIHIHIYIYVYICVDEEFRELSDMMCSTVWDSILAHTTKLGEARAKHCGGDAPASVFCDSCRFRRSSMC